MIEPSGPRVTLESVAAVVNDHGRRLNNIESTLNGNDGDDGIKAMLGKILGRLEAQDRVTDRKPISVFKWFALIAGSPPLLYALARGILAIARSLGS